MYCVDYQIVDDVWISLNIPFDSSDVLDALMDIWIERDKRLKNPNRFLDPSMAELHALEQRLLAQFVLDADCFSEHPARKEG